MLKVTLQILALMFFMVILAACKTLPTPKVSVISRQPSVGQECESEPQVMMLEYHAKAKNSIRAFESITVTYMGAMPSLGGNVLSEHVKDAELAKCKDSEAKEPSKASVEADVITDTLLNSVSLTSASVALPGFSVYALPSVDGLGAALSVPKDATMQVLELRDLQGALVKKYFVTTANQSLILTPISLTGIYAIGKPIVNNFRAIMQGGCGLAFDPDLKIVHLTATSQLLVLTASAGGATKNTLCVGLYMFENGKSIEQVAGSLYGVVNTNVSLYDYPVVDVFAMSTPAGVSHVLAVYGTNQGSLGSDECPLYLLKLEDLLVGKGAVAAKTNLSRTETSFGTAFRVSSSYVYSPNSGLKPLLILGPETPFMDVPGKYMSINLPADGNLVSATLSVAAALPGFVNVGYLYGCNTNCYPQSDNVLPDILPTLDNAQRSSNLENVDGRLIFTTTANTNANEYLPFDETPPNLGVRVSTYEMLSDGSVSIVDAQSYYVPGVNISNARVGYVRDVSGATTPILLAVAWGKTQPLGNIVVNLVNKKAFMLNVIGKGQTAKRIGDYGSIAYVDFVQSGQTYHATCSADSLPDEFTAQRLVQFCLVVEAGIKTFYLPAALKR